MFAQTLVSETMVQHPGDFRQALALQGRSKNTVDAYCQDVAVFATWAARRYSEPFDLAMFNRSDLQTFYQSQINDAKVAPATWNRRRAALRIYARWAIAAGLLSYDPTDGLQLAEEVKLAPRWLDGREMGRLERAVERAITAASTPAQKSKTIRDRAIVLLMAKGGLRESEVCALDLSDLTLGDRKGKVLVRNGKGSKTRTVPVNSQALMALRAWLDVRPDGGEAVFIGKQGERLQERGVQRLVADLGRQAGIEGLTPHRLRHTCAKSLLDSGAKLTEVATILGHGRLETTMRYTTPSEGDLAAAVEKI